MQLFLVQMLPKFKKTPYLSLPASTGLLLESSKIQFWIFIYPSIHTHTFTFSLLSAGIHNIRCSFT